MAEKLRKFAPTICGRQLRGRAMMVATQEETSLRGDLWGAPSAKPWE